MAKTWNPVTEAEVDEWRRLVAVEKLGVRAIARRTGRAQKTIADHLSGKRVPRKRLISGTPQLSASDTYKTCGKRGTKAMPLQRNADGKFRCVECAARWALEAKQGG